ncbi:NAD(P)/FAD-dependent oxidoreductase, partial [Oleiphilus sp. HI0066]|uniref:NAD(P)/FAD-dependent oxidoreductase n=3 Tax=Oleiphilus TaxID=141450 RepID=UPI0007C40021
LVLATGASPFKLKFVKPESDRIFSINDLDDYRAFRTASQGKKHVAIVGTGLIGCEYANDLLNGEYEVSLIGLSQHVLDTMLPPEASECVTKSLSDAGANFYFERSVVDIQETVDGVIVELDNGEKISADIAISAIGLAPNTKLASESGIETNKGITCDRSLETSAKNVYTLGDCAEVDGMVMLYVLPMMACARALASTLNDEPKLVSYGVMPVAVKTPACPVVVLPASNENGTWDIESDGFNTTALFKSDQGELLGFALTGDATKQKQVLAKQVQAIHPE